MANNDIRIEDGLDRELENILNHPAPPYGESSYWDTRYKSQKEQTYEWLLPWSDVVPHVEHRINIPRGDGLVIGCGNSALSQGLLDRVGRVTSIDTSSAVIEDMRERSSTGNDIRLEWQTMDCMKTTFAAHSYDLVVDKGTIDTLCCGDNGHDQVTATVKEMARVLRPGGIFVVITHGLPQTRKQFFDKANGFVLEDTIKIAKPDSDAGHYVYVARSLD